MNDNDNFDSRMHKEKQAEAERHDTENWKTQLSSESNRERSNKALNVPLSQEDKTQAVAASKRELSQHHLDNADSQTEAGRLHIKAHSLQQRVNADTWGLNKGAQIELADIETRLATLEQHSSTDDESQELEEFFDSASPDDFDASSLLNRKPEKPAELTFAQWQLLPEKERLKNAGRIQKRTDRGTW